MSLLALPNRQLWLPGQPKPPCGTQLDRTHPLVDHLAGCWMLNDGGRVARDLCGPNNLNLDANCYFNQYGIVTANAAYSWTQTAANVPVALINTSFSVLIKLVPSVLSAAYLPFISVRSNSGPAWNMQTTTSSNPASITFAINRTTGGWANATIANALTVGIPVTLVGVFDGVSSTLYSSNTTTVGSTTYAETTVTNISGSTSSYFAVGGDAYYHSFASGYSLSANVIAAMMWRRPLHPSEVRQLLTLSAGW